MGVTTNANPVAEEKVEGSSNDKGKKYTARVEFCTSWGMQRNYLQVKQFLEQEFPEVSL